MFYVDMYCLPVGPAVVGRVGHGASREVSTSARRTIEPAVSVKLSRCAE